MCSALDRALHQALEPPLGQAPPWLRENRHQHTEQRKRLEGGAELSLIEQRTTVLPKLTECMEAPARDDSAAFGTLVAEYLWSMPPAARAICQIAVMSAIAAHLD